MTDEQPDLKRGAASEELGDWNDVQSRQKAEQSASEGTAAFSSDLAALVAERDKYLELAKRTRADFENYQTRVRRDLEADRKYAAAALVADLLPVLDNLERALESAVKAAESGSIVDGIDIVRRQFADALAKNGVTPIKPQNEPFDPNLHQAVMQQPSTDHPPMTVLLTVETGYKMHDRVIRPAKVIVSAAG